FRLTQAPAHSVGGAPSLTRVLKTVRTAVLLGAAMCIASVRWCRHRCPHTLVFAMRFRTPPRPSKPRSYRHQLGTTGDRACPCPRSVGLARSRELRAERLAGTAATSAVRTPRLQGRWDSPIP